MAEGVRRLDYDFGLVPPNSTHYHAFCLKNDTALTWTLRSVITSCSCAVADISTRSIEPGQSAELKAELSVSDSSRQASRHMTVLFRESEAPRFDINLRAQIRETLTIEPKELNGTVSAHMRSTSFVCLMQNSSEVDWKSVRLSTSSEWLSAKMVRVPREELAGSAVLDGPREIWRIKCDVDITRLEPGTTANGFVSVYLDGIHTRHPATTIPVSVRVLPVVTVRPTHVFFGEVSREAKVSRSIVFRFANADVVPDIRSFSVKHQLGTALSCDWKKSDGLCWELVASFCPGSDFPLGIVDETITMRFAPPQGNDLAHAEPVQYLTRENRDVISIKKLPAYSANELLDGGELVMNLMARVIIVE